MTLITFRSAKNAPPEYTSDECLTLEDAAFVVRAGIGTLAKTQQFIFPGTVVRVLEKESPGRVDFTISYTRPGFQAEQYFSVVDTNTPQTPLTP